MPIQLQIIAIILAFVFLILTIRLVRKDHAEVRQVNKWFLLSFIMIIGAVFPKFGNQIAQKLGITTLTSLALFILTGVLLFISLTMNLNLIKLERQVKVLTQELSLLKKEVHDKGEKNDE